MKAGDVTINGYTFNTENLLYLYKKIGPTSLTLNIVVYTDADTDAPNIPGFGLFQAPGEKCAAGDREPYDCAAPFVLYHDLPLASKCAVLDHWFYDAGIAHENGTNNLISEDYAAWYLQAGGWVSPKAALNTEPTCDELNALHRLTNGLGNAYQSQLPFGGLREELWVKIYNQIKLLPSIAQFWKSSFLAKDSVFYKLYFASYQGLFIAYPAKAMSVTYNPLIRPWYRLATSHPNKFVVTTPYKDFSTGELVASGATAIIAPNSTHIFGVAAFDYKFSEFLKYCDDTLSVVCQETDGHHCYLIDSNAFLVYYDGIADDINDDDISHKFFGDIEPTLMQNMLDIGFFTSRTHKNYIDDSLDVSYSVDEDFYRSMELTEVRRTFQFNAGSWTVHQIPGTNLYWIHVDDWSLTGIYPEHCPEDPACSSVWSPGCIKDSYPGAPCVSIVEDVCFKPDTPTQSESTCSAVQLEGGSLALLEDGVESEFCATCFANDCSVPPTWWQSLSGGEQAGIIIGSILGFMCCVSVGWFLYCKWGSYHAADVKVVETDENVAVDKPEENVAVNVAAAVALST